MMKKLFFLMCIAIGLSTAVKAQNAATTVTYNYGYGANNHDTFTYYVSMDGYLHYSLLDGGGGANYESTFYVVYTDPYTNQTVNYWVTQNGGGNIVGSIYIGTNNTSFDMGHGAGYFCDSDEQYETEAWTIAVDFSEEE